MNREEKLRANMEPFLHFAKFMNHKGGFLWFDKVITEVVHEFAQVLKPSGLFLNNNGLMRIWTTPDLDENFFQTHFQASFGSWTDFLDQHCFGRAKGCKEPEKGLKLVLYGIIKGER